MGRFRHCLRALALAVVSALVPGCGNLDETNADPPSVKAVAWWDASHLVALRTYYKQPVLVDAATGSKTGTLEAGSITKTSRPSETGSTSVFTINRSIS